MTKSPIIWVCACCGNDADNLSVKDDGVVMCDECEAIDDYNFDVETYEEEKRRRIAEANEY